MKRKTNKTALKRRRATKPRAGKGGTIPPVAHRFKPGNSASPGRPPGRTLTTIIREVLTDPDAKHGTKADALIALAMKRARAGDFRFFKEIIDRNDGKVAERVANAVGEKLVIEVVRSARADNPD